MVMSDLTFQRPADQESPQQQEEADRLLRGIRAWCAADDSCDSAKDEDYGGAI